MAAGTGRYKRILQLLDKWPIDESKAGRDLGEFLRGKVNKAYKENKFDSDPKFWDQQYIALQKIINNEYKSKYLRLHTSSATGLSAEDCNYALSNDCMETLKQEDSKGFFSRLFSLKSKT